MEEKSVEHSVDAESIQKEEIETEVSDQLPEIPEVVFIEDPVDASKTDTEDSIVNDQTSLDGILDEARAVRERYLGFIRDISGADSRGNGKARVLLRIYEMYQDKTEGREIERLEFIKPVVSVMHSLGKFHVSIDFLDMENADLIKTFELYQRYVDLLSFATFLPEEVENGYYKDIRGNMHKIYYPMFSMTLTPLDKESAFEMTGYYPDEPVYTPSKLKSMPTMLQFTFDEETFVISETEKEEA